MPYRICKVLEIESGHLLSKHSGNCRFPHGHSRRIAVVVSSDSLDVNDMVCDFKLIKTHLQQLLAEWDHALCLNTADPQFIHFQQCYGPRIVPFAGCDPTSEIMARTLFEKLHHRLTPLPGSPAAARTLRLESVRVGETSSSWAEYGEP